MPIRNFGPSIYFYHDKAIFDGLCQHNVSKNNIQAMLLNKGVILSNANDKEEFALYLSSFPFDYIDKNKLVDNLKVYPKRENVSTCKIKNESEQEFTSDQIRTALLNLKNTISNNDDVNATVQQAADSIVLDISYKNYDLTKAEIKQVENKKSKIEVYIENNELTIRSPSNEYSSVIVEKLKESLKAETGLDLTSEEIDLSCLNDNNLVSKFFKKLINGLSGYELTDVTNVKLYHPIEKTDDDDVTSYIQKAILNGEGVLNSPELLALFERGFYICKIQWIVKDPLPHGEQISFEASLKDAKNKTGFSYQIRGIHRYSTRTQAPVQRFDVPSNIEKKDIHNKLDNAAASALESVINEQGI
jgi:hypothetical protein